LSNPDRINVEMLTRSACCAVQKAAFFPSGRGLEITYKTVPSSDRWYSISVFFISSLFVGCRKQIYLACGVALVYGLFFTRRTTSQIFSHFLISDFKPASR